jgi:hypothetical protein
LGVGLEAGSFGVGFVVVSLEVGVVGFVEALEAGALGLGAVGLLELAGLLVVGLTGLAGLLEVARALGLVLGLVALETGALGAGFAALEVGVFEGVGFVAVDVFVELAGLLELGALAVLVLAVVGFAALEGLGLVVLNNAVVFASHGIKSTCPISTVLPLSLFSLVMSATLEPYFLAMPKSVSPLATVCRRSGI